MNLRRLNWDCLLNKYNCIAKIKALFHSNYIKGQSFFDEIRTKYIFHTMTLNHNRTGRRCTVIMVSYCSNVIIPVMIYSCTIIDWSQNDEIATSTIAVTWSFPSHVPGMVFQLLMIFKHKTVFWLIVIFKHIVLFRLFIIFTHKTVFWLLMTFEYN